MDAIKFLKAEHRQIEQLLADFESLGALARKSRAGVIAGLSQALSIHLELEEIVFYPALQKYVGEDDLVLEGFESHHVLKFMLREIQAIDLDHPRFEARVSVLKDFLAHHFAEEEKKLFPQAKKQISAGRLRTLGDEMASLKTRCLAGTQGRVSIMMDRELPVAQHQEY